MTFGGMPMPLTAAGMPIAPGAPDAIEYGCTRDP
jgi:hypothetical protein